MKYKNSDAVAISIACFYFMCFLLPHL